MFRHLIGRPWHGQATPGASFWRRSPAERPSWFSRSGRPSPWRRLHPWQRALFWWVVYLGIPAAVWAWFAHRAAAELAEPAAGGVLAVAAVLALARKVHKRPRPVPRRVVPAGVRRHLEAATSTRLLVGMAANRRPVFVDLDSDSPHVGISSSTGGGKSNLATGLAVQMLHRGGIALVLDYKRTSFPWARDLPNVRYCRTIAEIHDGLMWLGVELDRRNEAADASMGYDGSFDRGAVGPPLTVLADEMNATSELLTALWLERGNKGPSPAARALRMSLFMGRATRVHAFAIAQQLTAAAAAAGGRQGGAARENLGVRVLIWHTEQTAKMLVPDLMPLPEVPHRVGRVLVCVGRSATQTQVVYWKPLAAREYVLSGTVTHFPAAAAPVPPPPPLPKLSVVPDQGAGEGEGRGAGAPVPLRRGLREASSDLGAGVVPLRYEALRWARRSDPAFPAGARTGRGRVYSDPELKRWHAARVQRGTGTEK